MLDVDRRHFRQLDRSEVRIDPEPHQLFVAQMRLRLDPRFSCLQPRRQPFLDGQGAYVGQLATGRVVLNLPQLLLHLGLGVSVKDAAPSFALIVTTETDGGGP